MTEEKEKIEELIPQETEIEEDNNVKHEQIICDIFFYQKEEKCRLNLILSIEIITIRAPLFIVHFFYTLYINNMIVCEAS
jgi:hypothetical protein